MTATFISLGEFSAGVLPENIGVLHFSTFSPRGVFYRDSAVVHYTPQGPVRETLSGRKNNSIGKSMTLEATAL